MGIFPYSYDYTYQNGRLIRVVIKIGHPGTDLYYTEILFEHNYDNNGRRISTNETHNHMGKRQYTRTYNSDGTLQKVVYGDYEGYPKSGSTSTYTWENGKSTINEDDFG